jgi:hypothetical protein
MDNQETILKTIDTLNPEETSWNKMVETVNQLIKRVNGQSALIQLQKDEIDKLKDWQKEVEKTYPFTKYHIDKPVMGRLHLAKPEGYFLIEKVVYGDTYYYLGYTTNSSVAGCWEETCSDNGKCNTYRFDSKEQMHEYIKTHNYRHQDIRLKEFTSGDQLPEG